MNNKNIDNKSDNEEEIVFEDDGSVKEDTRTDKRKTGDLGEEIVSMFLMKRGFKIVDRNYLRKYGELDIVATKARVYHFVEVKTVSCERLPQARADVIHETADAYRPEDNLHPWKLKRLTRVIQAYILDKKLFETEWQFDVATVYLDMKTRKARVFLFEDIVL